MVSLSKLIQLKLEGTKNGRADDVSIDDEDEVDDIGDNEADDGIHPKYLRNEYL